MILQLHGHAKIYLQARPRISSIHWINSGKHWIPANHSGGCDLVQTSCGFAVPFIDFKEERETLNFWSTKQGIEGIERYWEEKTPKVWTALRQKSLRSRV